VLDRIIVAFGVQAKSTDKVCEAESKVQSLDVEFVLAQWGALLARAISADNGQG
jgi:hypothetical protein